MNFSDMQQTLDDFRNGRMIIVADDESRENEGDIVQAAECATPESINFMIRNACGLVCTPISPDRARNLQLEPMCNRNTSAHETAFTVSIDHVSCSTGISALERSDTVRALGGISAKSSDFVRPGHIFPLIAKSGGVIERTGHTEAAYDLTRLTEHNPAAVICEILNEDGTMARRDSLFALAQKYGLKIITVNQVIEHRRQTEIHVMRGPEAKMPTEYGEFRLISYVSQQTGDEHIVLLSEQIKGEPLVRIHSECMTGDVFHSLRCDCGIQLSDSMQAVAKTGGAVIYMRQEGRGIGLLNKLRTYRLQEQGYDTQEANTALGFLPDERNYHEAAHILKDLGMKKIRLITNNPDKITGLNKYGIDVYERISAEIVYRGPEIPYMMTKKEKMNHVLSV